MALPRLRYLVLLLSSWVWYMALWVVVPFLKGPRLLPLLGVAPMSPEPPPGAGTGYVRFDEGPLDFPPAPMSSQPVNQVLPPGPPSGCAAPLPVGPVVDSVADQLRALELLSSFMDPPEVEALRSRLVPPPTPVPSEPVLTSHRALAQDLAEVQATRKVADAAF